MCVNRRTIAGKSPWIGKEKEEDEEEVANELAAFLEYYEAVLGNQLSKTSGQLVAVSFHHQQLVSEHVTAFE